ncbi:patatin-like phospholipase family protein [Candidatus Peregrinibacteria bacterium]|nr:patatin-like phospholipase family protein [Candidatus Peregrinibacteria bacterium]
MPIKEKTSVERPIVNGKIYPRIGLAIGSGAAKAICQFGLLKKFRDHEIPISYIMGSSMGAIIGGIFASGMDIDKAIEKSAKYAEMSNINNLANFNLLHESIYKKDYTDQMLRELFFDLRFEDCKIPLAVTAVDLESGEAVLLNKGPLVPAIRASTSIPGVFAPVLLDEKYLVDGGLLEDCPIDPLRKTGQCDLIFGSYISDNKNRQLVSGLIYKKFYSRVQKGFLRGKIDSIKNDLSLLSSIIGRSLDILREQLWEYKLREAKPDLMININTEKVNLFDFEKTKDLVALGEKVFDQNFEAMKQLIESKQKELNAKSKNVKL